MKPILLLHVSFLSLAASFMPSSMQAPKTRYSTTSALGMFTGIVEEMGSVVSLEERDDMTLWDGTKGKGTELTVKGEVVMEGAYLG